MFTQNMNASVDGQHVVGSYNQEKGIHLPIRNIKILDEK